MWWFIIVIFSNIAVIVSIILVVVLEGDVPEPWWWLICAIIFLNSLINIIFNISKLFEKKPKPPEKTEKKDKGIFISGHYVKEVKTAQLCEEAAKE